MSDTIKPKNPVTISAEELRVNLASYLGRVMYADEMIVVKKYNRDAAVILSPRMLRWLLDSAQATRKGRATALKQLDALVGKIPAIDLSEDAVSSVVDHEVKTARSHKHP